MSNPKLVSSRDTNSRANLEFPLARHHFSIDTTDIDASIKTGFVMRIYDITAKGLVSTITTIVWSLWSRITTEGPPHWPLYIFSQQGVLLLYTVPRFLSSNIGIAENFCSVVPLICWKRLSSRGVGITHNKNVMAPPKWVPENRLGI